LNDEARKLMNNSLTSIRGRVLVVCLGNICRSPAAEGILRAAIDREGFTGQIQVESAGTANFHSGRPADPRMKAAASRRGYQLEGTARQLMHEDLRKFDLILAMDRDNLRAIHQLGDVTPGCARLFSDFLGPEWPSDVPDPYYGGETGFEYVLDMLEAGAPAVIDHIVADKRLSKTT
jgi:protein-tyrosine phosphatase